MPLESAPHQRTLMQWPVSVDVYGARDLAAVQASIVDIANAIGEHEPIKRLDACGFDPKDRTAILGGTAARLFGIEAQASSSAA